MATAVDHQALKIRIRDTLRASSSLFNSTDLGANNTFRDIEVGTPDARKINELNHPSLFITSSEIIEDASIIGVVEGDQDSASEHTIRYLVVFTTDAKDGRTAEQNLDAFGKIIAEVLRANWHLGTPSAPTTNRLAIECYPEQLAILNRDLAGSSVQGRVWRVRVRVHTS